MVEGPLDVSLNGAWHAVGPGETATAPAGVAHTLRNATDEPVKAITRIRPAGKSEAFFRDMHRLIHEGKLRHLPSKEPRSAIFAAMLFERYPGEIRVTGPLRGVFKVLALTGRALGFRLD